MKKRMTLIGLLIASVLLAGCVASAKKEFFGMRLLSADDSEAFSKVSRDIDGKMHYTYKKEKASFSTYCWGEIRGGLIILTIVNNSKKPVELNYFWDEYKLWTMDGTNYKLKIDNEITDYPDSLNPEKQVEVRLTGYDGRADDVKFIMAGINYGKIAIFLRRIELENG